MDIPSTDKLQTAVQKVFYLPELLESILSHVRWPELFVLQRVNTTFQRTISDSRALQTRMELNELPPLRSFTGSKQPCDFVGPLLPEFTFCSNSQIRFCTKFDWTGEGKNLKRHIDYFTITTTEGTGEEDGDESQLSKKGGELGLAYPVAFHANNDERIADIDVDFPPILVNPKGSWRRLKLSILPCVLVVKVRVDIRHSPAPYLPSGKDSWLKIYKEFIVLHADRLTYGDLADVMQETTRKSTEEHMGIWRGLNGRQRIGLGPDRFVASATGGQALIERWRVKTI